MLRKSLVISVIFGLILCVPLAHADDVTDAMNKALEQYKSGNYTDASSSLNYATQLILQKKGEALQSALPEPLAGWQAENGDVSAGAAMFGGGVSVERLYSKGDTRTVTVGVVADSPLIQGVLMMISNPIMMAGDNGKLATIAGQRAVVNYDQAGQSGEITIPVANRFLVNVSGNDVSLQDLQSYAKAVDYNKLTGMP